MSAAPKVRWHPDVVSHGRLHTPAAAGATGVGRTGWAWCNPFQRRVEQLQHLSFGESYLHPTLTLHGTRRRRHIRLLVSSVSWTSALGSPSTASLAPPFLHGPIRPRELHRFTSIFATGQRLGPEIARCEPTALAGLAGVSLDACFARELPKHGSIYRACPPEDVVK